MGRRPAQAAWVRHQLRQDLAKFLRAKRGKRTLAQFARKTGISTSTLQRLEIGDQNITIDTLEQILNRLGSDVHDIFSARHN